MVTFVFKDDMYFDSPNIRKNHRSIERNSVHERVVKLCMQKLMGFVFVF